MNITNVPTPCYVVDEAALERNLQVLDSVQKRTGCKIIMALKGFAMFSVFPRIRRYLKGVAASSIDEARLGFEEFGGEVHTFAPAYRDFELDELLHYSDHMVFNSFPQWERFKARALAANVSCGIRVNPEHSEVK
ncbi:MAG: carboxynorspermidine decarboxylase, partial [Acidobacteriota bacterium]